MTLGFRDQEVTSWVVPYYLPDDEELGHFSYGSNARKRNNEEAISKCPTLMT